MTVDWTGETIAWIVLGVSTLYLADRLVVWLGPVMDVGLA